MEAEDVLWMYGLVRVHCMGCHDDDGERITEQAEQMCFIVFELQGSYVEILNLLICNE